MSVVSPVTQPANDVLDRIAAWPHWNDVALVAHKEYGVETEEFQHLLPEYRRFLALIALGYIGLGMFSNSIDRLWHSHILMTYRYQDFCASCVGHFVHHSPNLAAFTAGQCEAPPTPPACIPDTPPGKCNAKCEEGASGEASSAQRFAQIYQEAFGEWPGELWNLPRADGIAM